MGVISGTPHHAVDYTDAIKRSNIAFARRMTVLKIFTSRLLAFGVYASVESASPFAFAFFA
jgi:hypothetical protein